MIDPKLLDEFETLKRADLLVGKGNLGKLRDFLPLLIAEIRRLHEVESFLLAAHTKALPPNWVYTDSQTTIDLLVAEIIATRHERDGLQEVERAAKAHEITIRGLRRRVHMLEGHNQHLEHCESGWCSPSQDCDPATDMGRLNKWPYGCDGMDALSAALENQK